MVTSKQAMVTEQAVADGHAAHLQVLHRHEREDETSEDEVGEGLRRRDGVGYREAGGGVTSHLTTQSGSNAGDRMQD